jgi:RNA polymerase sigma-70 factor (ECF subfamily)
MMDEPDPLLRRLQRGDSAAFRELYAREKAALYGFLMRLARDPDVAADLFQNVWLKLAKHASALRPDSNVRAWLHTVARHEYVSFRRAQALDLSRLLLLGLQTPTAPGDSALDAQLLALKLACDRLSDADREVLLLSSTEGLDSDAVAEVLGISNAALRQRLVRARRRLGSLLDADDEPAAPAALRKGNG